MIKGKGTQLYITRFHKIILKVAWFGAQAGKPERSGMRRERHETSVLTNETRRAQSSKNGYCFMSIPLTPIQVRLATQMNDFDGRPHIAHDYVLLSWRTSRSNQSTGPLL